MKYNLISTHKGLELIVLHCELFAYFNLLVNNITDKKYQLVIAFTFVNMSKITFKYDLQMYDVRFIPRLEQWRITDSNRWPPACKAGALASWANPPLFIVPYKRVLHHIRSVELSFSSPAQSWTADLHIISVAL